VPNFDLCGIVLNQETDPLEKGEVLLEGAKVDRSTAVGRVNDPVYAIAGEESGSTAVVVNRS
jgi:hypothetical protein